MSLRRAAFWLGVAFVIYYLATSPGGAAGAVTAAIGWLKGAASSLSTFLNHVRW